MSVQPENSQLAQQFKKHEDAIMDAMGTIEEQIFTELHKDEANLVGTVVGKLTAIEIEAGLEHEYIFAEVCNAIAAAAAIEFKSYDNLVSVVGELSKVDKAGTRWKETAFYVTLRCMENHLSQTRYFLLKCLLAGVIEIHWIYKFLSVEHCMQPHHMALFLYFAPELQAYKKNWFCAQWRDVHTVDLRRNNVSLASMMCADLKDSIDNCDWEAFKTKRNAGVSESPILKAIREDNFGELKDIMKEESFADKKITFDLYEGYLHKEFIFNLDTNKDTFGPAAANIFEVIGAFNAEKCLTGALMLVEDKMTQVLEAAKAYLVGNQAMVKIIENKGANFSGVLKDVIRCHNNDAVEYLLNKEAGRAAVDMDAAEAAMVYANFTAFLIIENNLPAAGNGFTIYHAMAKGNAVTAFRAALSKAKTFDPYAATETNCTFLHYAGKYQSWEVAKAWCDSYKNFGLDAIDKVRQYNPVGYAFHFGVYPKPANKSMSYQEKLPGYGYMFHMAYE